MNKYIRNGLLWMLLGFILMSVSVTANLYVSTQITSPTNYSLFYISYNDGTTFSNTYNMSNIFIKDIKTSSDGHYINLVGHNVINYKSYMINSNDSGKTFYEIENNQYNITNVAMSKDGKYVYYGTDSSFGEFIEGSANYGQDFISRQPYSNTAGISYIATSYAGDVVIAFTSNGELYRSTNYGVTFTRQFTVGSHSFDKFIGIYTLYNDITYIAYYSSEYSPNTMVELIKYNMTSGLYTFINPSDGTKVFPDNNLNGIIALNESNLILSHSELSGYYSIFLYNINDTSVNNIEIITAGSLKDYIIAGNSFINFYADNSILRDSLSNYAIKNDLVNNITAMYDNGNIQGECTEIGSFKCISQDSYALCDYSLDKSHLDYHEIINCLPNSMCGGMCGLLNNSPYEQTYDYYDVCVIGLIDVNFPDLCHHAYLNRTTNGLYCPFAERENCVLGCQDNATYWESIKSNPIDMNYSGHCAINYLGLQTCDNVNDTRCGTNSTDTIETCEPNGAGYNRWIQTNTCINNAVCKFGACYPIGEEPITPPDNSNISFYLKWSIQFRYLVMLICSISALLIFTILLAVFGDATAGVLVGLVISMIVSLTLTIILQLSLIIPILYIIIGGAIVTILFKKIFG